MYLGERNPELVLVLFSSVSFKSYPQIIGLIRGHQLYHTVVSTFKGNIDGLTCNWCILCLSRLYKTSGGLMERQKHKDLFLWIFFEKELLIKKLIPGGMTVWKSVFVLNNLLSSNINAVTVWCNKMMRVHLGIMDLASEPANSSYWMNNLHLSETLFTHVSLFSLFLMISSLIFCDLSLVMWWTCNWSDRNPVDYDVWIQFLPNGFWSFYV